MYKAEVEGKGGIYAKVIVASACNGVSIYSLELRYPRFIHSEFMTHRLFSRNASSSRAIPVKKMLEQVKKDPAMPIHWGMNQPGMQAGKEVTVLTQTFINGYGEKAGHFVHPREVWLEAAEEVHIHAETLMKGDLHKQIVNRLLEPWQFITVIVTATEWDNFFRLRLHPDAQPEIQELARCMKGAMDSVECTELAPGEWHLPYVTSDEYNGSEESSVQDAVNYSVARCARVSYLNHDKSEPAIAKDLALAYMLSKSGHYSPFEHQATPMGIPLDSFGEPSHAWWNIKGITHEDRNGDLWSGNFCGWIQNRQLK